ncbi:hypothetical protein [Adonisia turfae]|nr:hypothetical protein [Adonisia turfae]
MPTISIAAKFHGSLMGAYLGHSYGAGYRGPWLPLHESPLYQSWLHGTQQNLLQPTPTDANPLLGLPWLLHHHDNSDARHRWLAQIIESGHHTEAISVTETMATLGILGDCLAWLMHYNPVTQHSPPLLSQHLSQQLPDYPASLIPQAQHIIECLDPPSPTLNLEALDPQPSAIMVLAIQQSLSYRENLALAIAHPDIVTPIPAMIGCLLGAWGGMSVIPTRWILTIPPEQRHSLEQIASKLYRHWAGIANISANCEVFPLDL